MENWQQLHQEVSKGFDDLLKELSRAYKVARNFYKIVRRIVLYIRRKKMHEKLEKSIGQGTYQETLSICDQIIEINPNDFNALLQKGISLCKSEIYEEGIESLKKAKEINSRNAEVFIELGVAYSCVGESWRAIYNYNRALFHASNNASKVRALTFRGDEYMQMPSYWKACSDYTAVLSIERRNHVVASKLGLCLYNMGRNESALEAFQESLNIKSDYNPAIYYRIISLTALDRTEEALKICNEQLLLEPESLKYLLLKSRFLCSLQYYDDAMSICDNVLSMLSPENSESEIDLLYRAEAFLRKGNALVGLGQYKEATTAYELAIRNGDENCKYCALVGNAQSLECQDRFGEALEAYHTAFNINGTSSFVLARYYRLMNIVALYNACVVMKSTEVFSLSLGPISLRIG